MYQSIPHPDPPALQKPPTPVPFGGEAARPSFQTGFLTHGYPEQPYRGHTSKCHCKLGRSSHRFLWDSHQSRKRFFKTESTACPRKPFTAFEPYRLKHFTPKVTAKMRR